MKKTLWLLLVMLFCSGCGRTAGAEDFVSKMDRAMDHFTKLEYFSGVVLVAHKGETLYAKAFGEANKDFHIPNRLHTRFELGSIAKIFTGIAVMQLVEEGKLSLDDPVQKHLPDFPFGDKITLFHLLSHTSGLPDWTSHPRFRSIWSQVRTIGQMKTLVFDQKLKHESPGEKFEYNSSGFILLGAILERVYNKSFAAVIKDHILDPLEMKETSIANPENVVENRALGYVKSSTGRFSTNVYWLLPFIASAGIQTTAADMLKLDQALSAGTLISLETQEKMYEPVVDKNWGTLWRLGETAGGRIVWHGGETTGVSAMFRRYPDTGYTLIILSNYHRAGRPLTAVVEPLLFGQPYELPKPTLMEYLFQAMMEKGVGNTLRNFDDLIEKSGHAVGSPDDLNGFGYELMDEERLDMALAIFKLNCRLFPDEANTYDSLAEACLRAGDPESALANYEKALEIDPGLGSAKIGLKNIKSMLKR